MIHHNAFHLKSLGIDTYKEAVLYIRGDSPICIAEGLESQTRVQVTLAGKSLIATVHTIHSDLLNPHEASLSHYAWGFLEAKEGDTIQVAPMQPVESLSFIRAKVYGNELSAKEMHQIVSDVVAGRLSDIYLTMFLCGAAGNQLTQSEVLELTRAMIQSGQQLSWSGEYVVDKHCVGGLPGNRTTLIIVPIVAAFGLTIPKTSSRAITSPAGTADTMEIFSRVNLTLPEMRAVVEKEQGCIVWGGHVALSPADDLLIRIERVMDVDSEGQMVASILSKKIAACSRHLLIDIPIGSTAKVRTVQQATYIKNHLESTAKAFSLELKVVFSDGTQPIGHGMGPALEAKDVWAVLSNHPNASPALRDHALTLAGHILEFSPNVPKGTGKSVAKSLLDSGAALKKFEAICYAQGGLFEIPTAHHQYVISAERSGILRYIDNRLIARVAKLAGAPHCKAAGVELLVTLGDPIVQGQPLFIIHTETKSALQYTRAFISQGYTILRVEE